MHTLEPYYSWRHFYIAAEDEKSPFYDRVHSEFEFSDRVYNYLIHPQWENFGSRTLYMKVLFAEYDLGYAVLEFIGEWNDAIENDIMTLKRDVLEIMLEAGINKFILIGENVLNFHYSDDSYYEEWFEEIEDGWIALVNFHEHVLDEFKRIRLDSYLVMGGELNELDWRTYTPLQLCKKVDANINAFLLP